MGCPFFASLASRFPTLSAMRLPIGWGPGGYFQGDRSDWGGKRLGQSARCGLQCIRSNVTEGTPLKHFRRRRRILQFGTIFVEQP
jgi:hypothetical protein